MMPLPPCSQWTSYLLTFNPVTLRHTTPCQAVHSPKDQMEKEGVGKVRGGR